MPVVLHVRRIRVWKTTQLSDPQNVQNHLRALYETVKKKCNAIAIETKVLLPQT